MKDEEIAGMVREIRILEKEHNFIVITLSAHTLFCVISALQLALRHPEIGNVPDVQELILKFAIETQSAFKDSPLLNSIIEEAWQTIEQEKGTQE